MVEHQKVSLAKYRLGKREKSCRQEEAGWEPLSVALQVPDLNAQKQFDEVENGLTVEKLLPQLSEKRQSVLKMIFYDDLTLEETGNQMGLSKERVRQIRIEAIRSLRHIVASQNRTV